MMSAVPWEPRDEMRSFLKDLRRRIDPAIVMLGEYERLTSRRGKAVSQEELAEAVGVSRGWYGLLESGAPIRPSVAMLNRLASALNATPQERKTLIELAIPALQSSFPDPAKESFESISFVRAALHRLRAASSEDETVVAAAQHLATWFTDAALIVPAKRIDAGCWKWWIAVDRGPGAKWSQCLAAINNLATPQQFDEFWTCPKSGSPGEIVDHSALTGFTPELRRVTFKAYKQHNIDVTSFLRARITARSGMIGCIQVSHRTGRSYSDLDRAVLAAVADLTSLALS